MTLVLTPEKHDRYTYFFNFVKKLNLKATDLIPLEEDIDKRKEIRLFIYERVRTNIDTKMLFNQLKDLVTNLEVVNKNDINRYDILNDKIVKIL